MKKLLFGISLLAVSASAGYKHSLDLKSGWISNPMADSLKGSVVLQGFYNGRVSLDNGVYIPADMRLFAYTLPALDDRVGTPVEKYTTPNSYSLYTGIGWKGPVDIRARGYYRLNSGNRELVMPWSLSEKTEYLSGRFNEKNHAGFDFNFIVPTKRFDFQFYSLNLFANQNYINDEMPGLYVGNTKDHDWWVTSNGSLKFLDEKLAIVGEVVHKNDLADQGAYDLTMGKIGFGTDLRIKKKWRIWGDLSGRFYDNRRMYEKGYLNDGGLTKNLGITTDVRTFLALKKRLYIKGDIKADISNRMTKLRYDMAVRKVWKKQRITGQVGYWSTPGSLFPRSCTYYGGSFGVGKNLDILPQAKLYWQWNKQEQGYTYNHTDLNLEVNYNLPDQSTPFFTRFTILGGVDYKLFADEVLFFSNQISAYLGVRTQL